MHPTTPAPRFDITPFREMLVRLSVRAGMRLEHASQYDVYPAGAEANVLTLLSRLERKTCWVGALPNNPLGRLAFNALRGAGVDTQGVLWKAAAGWGRIGGPVVGRTGLETGARAPDAHP